MFVCSRILEMSRLCRNQIHQDARHGNSESEGEAILGDARMKWSVDVTRTLGTLQLCSLGEGSRLWRTMWRSRLRNPANHRLEIGAAAIDENTSPPQRH
jgi:hypothetical protein